MNYKEDIAKAVFRDGGVELLTKYVTDCTTGTDTLDGNTSEDKASNLAIDFSNEEKYKAILHEAKGLPTFDHTTQDMQEAMGVDMTEFKSNLYNVVQKYLKQDSAKLSEIAEDLEKNLSSREITLVASREVLRMLEELHSNPLRMLLSALEGKLGQ